MREAILILAGGANQISFVLSLRCLGVATVVVDRDEYAACRRLSDYFVCESVDDPRAILAKIGAFRETLRFVAVWTQSSGLATVTQTILARELGIEHFSQELAKIAIDKGTFVNFLWGNGFRIPPPVDKHRVDTDFRFPLVVRPAVTTAGKHMIFRVDNVDGLTEALKQAQHVSATGEVQISEYVEGDDLILACIRVKNSLQLISVIREYNIFKDGKVINLGYELVRDDRRYPVNLMLNEINRLFDLTGGGQGVFLASFRSLPDDFHWIELHLNFGGEHLFDKLLSHAIGRDSVSWICRQLLWSAKHEEKTALRASTLYTLVRSDWEKLPLLTGLLEDPDIDILIENVTTLRSDADRIGMVSITKESENCCKAVAIRVDTLLARSTKSFPPLSEQLFITK